MLNVSGIFASRDNGTGIVGVAPECRVVFSATNAPPGKNAPSAPANTLAPAAGYVGIALLNDPSEVKAGDIVNFSIAVDTELDQNKSPNVGPSLPATLSGARGNPGALRIVTLPGQPTKMKRIAATIPLEFDPALLALLRQFASRGVTVCMGAGNGFEATYLVVGSTTERDMNTGIGANLSENWLRQSHSLDRSASTFKDGGGVIVGGGFFSTSKNINARNPNFSFGNRIDCFAQGNDVLTWATSNLIRAAGTSVATPIVTGAAALIQHYVRKNYQQSLKPRVVRALLSDPLLNTPAEPGSKIGFMPDLAKIMPLLKTTPFDKAALIKALEANAVNVHADVAKQKAAIAKSATPTASGAAAPWIHDPYTIWDEQNKKWNDMPLNSDQDVFN
jgi:subtilisin family serine protease